MSEYIQITASLMLLSLGIPTFLLGDSESRFVGLALTLVGLLEAFVFMGIIE